MPLLSTLETTAETLEYSGFDLYFDTSLWSVLKYITYTKNAFVTQFDSMCNTLGMGTRAVYTYIIFLLIMGYVIHIFNKLRSITL